MIIVDSTSLVIKPSLLIYVLDTAGNKISIAYKNYQPVGTKNTGRDIYFNFENAAGHLYSSNGVIDEEQTAILFTEEFFTTHTMVKVTRTDKKGLPEQVKKKIETDKVRKIKTVREYGQHISNGILAKKRFSFS